MTKMMYHINPNTGVPSRCHARNGRCPYGGTSGMSNHFDTFTEAQAYAQEMMEDKYEMLPAQVAEYGDELGDIDRMLQDKVRADSESVSNFSKMSRYQQGRTISSTNNKDLLMGVINGEVGDGDWGVIGPALQNRNVPRELLEEMLVRYPDEFGEETRRWAGTNLSLSNRDLQIVLKNEKDNDVKSVIYTNENLDRYYIEHIIRDKPPEVLARPPYTIIFNDDKNRGLEEVEKVREQVESQQAFKDMSPEANHLINKYYNVESKT